MVGIYQVNPYHFFMSLVRCFVIIGLDPIIHNNGWISDHPSAEGLTSFVTSLHLTL